MSEETVLALDIGTTSLKAAFISEKGRVLSFCRRPFLLSGTQHASREWLPALQNALKSLFASSPETRPCGISVSGNGPTLVSQSGETFFWNESVVQGSFSSFFIPRLLAFKDRFSSSWKETPFIYGAPEYFIWLLTGESFSVLPSERFLSAYWTKEELSVSGLSEEDQEKLPPFVSPLSILSYLSSRTASFLGEEENGIKEGLPIFCGVPDFVSALLGSGAVEEGVLCDRAGSSEGLNLCCSSPIKGDGIRSLPSVIEGLWNASVLLPESGSLFDSFKQKIEREEGNQIEYSELIERLITSDGTSSSLDQGKYLLIQLALNLKDASEVLKKAFCEEGKKFPSQVRVSGGQAKNALWNQMKADITSFEVVVPSCKDAELLGDALFAFCAMKIFPDLSTASKTLFKAEQVYYPSSVDKSF